MIPTHIDPKTQPDNILCRMEAVPPTAYVLDEQREEFFNGIRAMFAAFKPRGKSQQWEWWLDTWWPTSPRYPTFFMRRLQQTRQEQRKYFDGFFMEAPPDQRGRSGRIAEMPLNHLMLYVNCKLLWDPDLDALLDEYYKLWFGPAEREMKSFHAFAEAVWTRQGSRSVSEVNGFLRRTDVPRYFELLDAAKARTQPGTVYFNRIAAMEQGYAGLKTIFDDRIPLGPSIQAGVLADGAQADGDFAKYPGAWLPLTIEGNGDGQSGPCHLRRMPRPRSHQPGRASHPVDARHAGARAEVRRPQGAGGLDSHGGVRARRFIAPVSVGPQRPPRQNGGRSSGATGAYTAGDFEVGAIDVEIVLNHATGLDGNVRVDHRGLVDMGCYETLLRTTLILLR